jgi:hypothetical protein
VKYCETSGAPVSPKVWRNPSSACGLSRPLKRAKSAVAGSPGISRGRKKFKVSATQAASK